MASSGANTGVIEAIIALVGILISIAVSLFVSLRRTNLEIEKLRNDMKNAYASKLTDQRLSCYPDAYRILSQFTKRLRFEPIIVKEDLESLEVKLGNWDSSYALFCSSGTAYLLHNFMMHLHDLTLKTDEEVRQQFDVPEKRKKFRRRLSELELALKNDIGIYIVDFAELSKEFSSYEDLLSHIKVIKRKEADA